MSTMTTSERPRRYRNNLAMELSPREREVVTLIARGRTNGEIATDLGIGFETAKTHVSTVIGKLGVGSREEAAAAWHEYNNAGARFTRSWLAVVGLGSSKPFLLGAAGAVAATAAGIAIIAMLVSRDSDDPLVANAGSDSGIVGSWVGKADIATATWRFTNDGKFSLDVGAEEYYRGTYVVDGTEVEIIDEQVDDACAPGQNRGIYSWTVVDGLLKLAPLEEPCTVRAFQIAGGTNLRRLP